MELLRACHHTSADVIADNSFMVEASRRVRVPEWAQPHLPGGNNQVVGLPQGFCVTARNPARCWPNAFLSHMNAQEWSNTAASPAPSSSPTSASIPIDANITVRVCVSSSPHCAALQQWGCSVWSSVSDHECMKFADQGLWLLPCRIFLRQLSWQLYSNRPDTNSG
jgi:hypothetical protein